MRMAILAVRNLALSKFSKTATLMYIYTEGKKKTERQCAYKVTLRVVRVTVVAAENNITYSVCVCVCVCVCGLVIQHEKRIRRVVLSSVASADLQYSCILSHKQHDFWKKV